jgi:hypothetical protein
VAALPRIRGRRNAASRLSASSEGPTLEQGSKLWSHQRSACASPDRFVL